MKKKPKLSSYQKMKREYELRICELTADIITLIEDKDPLESITVKMKWHIRLSIEQGVWQGDYGIWQGISEGVAFRGLTTGVDEEVQP